MKEKTNKSESTKNKLFLSLCVIVVAIAILLILLNNFVRSHYYIYSQVGLQNRNLNNGYKIYTRMPITSIEESVQISNRFLCTIAIFVIFIGGAIVSIISERLSKPIVELNNIAKKMCNLDFSQKYKASRSNDKIDALGKSINTMSEKLEATKMK